MPNLLHMEFFWKTIINNTISLINNITDASKEQQAGIEQINDAVTELDQATQQNALAALNINSMSKEIQSLSYKLLETANHVKFDQKSIRTSLWYGFNNAFK